MGMHRSILRRGLSVAALIVGPLAIMAIGPDNAGAATPAPYTVALASCFEHYSATFGVSYSVRVDVDAYNLPPTADGHDSAGRSNTDFYYYPVGSTVNPNEEGQMDVTNGQGWGAAEIDPTTNGPASPTVYDI